MCKVKRLSEAVQNGKRERDREKVFIKNKKRERKSDRRSEKRVTDSGRIDERENRVLN